MSKMLNNWGLLLCLLAAICAFATSDSQQLQPERLRVRRYYYNEDRDQNSRSHARGAVDQGYRGRDSSSVAQAGAAGGSISSSPVTMRTAAYDPRSHQAISVNGVPDRSFDQGRDLYRQQAQEGFGKDQHSYGYRKYGY